MEKQSTTSLAFSACAHELSLAFVTNWSGAGSRDSALTNHGFQQATRLGQHFKAFGLIFTHLFSSHLQRAAKTAGKIREAQTAPASDDTPARLVPEVVQLPALMEQDFGSMEGKKFFDRPPESKITGKEHHRQKHKEAAGFVDVESKEAMARRADSFLDEHLLPLLDGQSQPAEKCVAIVSHGIFLSTLWKRLLLRLPPKSVELCPELQATARPSLEHLGGWSNTGYLELYMTQPVVPEPIPTLEQRPISPLVPSSSPTEESVEGDGLGKVEILQVTDEGAVATNQAVDASVAPSEDTSRSSTLRTARGWTTTILTINGKDHLKGLKRTGGGVGSSRHDASQKSIETFFKRRKVE